MTAFFSLMREQKVELLAPAGDYACFLAAIKAGADAVYLAGNQFGARAYAENFTEEELIKAIDTAHIYHRKVYMTVNTLLKPDETEKLVSYMKPYYEAGLDGVIIQDLGVFEIMKQNFPGMELHCSTQMTLTGVDGAAFAAEIGADRIVPARELRLEEIREIHECFPNLELECFIHGALCYCYSGQCLFSSMIGGRSGNRGRCAQPCRLAYDVMTDRNEHEVYPLSLKDLSTIEIISDLIGAGIYSFKIEGRMKSPEYVAGVTGVYRTVIDRYLSDPEHYDGPKKEERKVLSTLYVRSETEEGYYHHDNGRHMITPDKPSYTGCSEETLDTVRDQFMGELPLIDVRLECELRKGERAKLTASTKDASVSVCGEIVMDAKNRPILEADITKQLVKTGGTEFSVSDITISCDEGIFMPVSQLNELRRSAVEGLRERILKDYRRLLPTKRDEQQDNATETMRHIRLESNIDCFHTYVRTADQLKVCEEDPMIKRIYVDSTLWNELNPSMADRYWAALPRIIRQRNRSRIHRKLHELLEQKKVQGIYVYTLDGYELAKQLLTSVQMSVRDHIILAPSVYVTNAETARFWSDKCKAMSLPLELNEKELIALSYHLLELNEKNDGIQGDKNVKKAEFELPVYGRIPFMITANCLRKNFSGEGCVKRSEISYLKDRKQNRLPVWNDCENCYNIIYNSVPLSLHKHVKKLRHGGIADSMMLSFSVETGKKTKQILQYYQSLLFDIDGFKTEEVLPEYTNGHFSRGVL